jgi:hypothetical protein
MNEKPTEKELCELDAYCAEFVMGWRIHTSGRGSIIATEDFNGPNERERIIDARHPWDSVDWSPSTDAADAMQVLKACLSERGPIEICENANKTFTVMITESAPVVVGHGANLEIALANFARYLFSKESE